MSNCNVIAISNQKCEVGKRIIILSLRVALFKLGKKILLMEADLQRELTVCMRYYEQEMMSKNKQEKTKTNN